MKKNNIKFYLLIIICSCFIMSINAKAGDFDIGSSFYITQVGEAQNNNLTFADGSSANIYEYSATSKGGTTYEAFCIDPHLSFMKGDYTVQTGENPEYLAGVSAIISSGGSYVAKDTALRAFTYGFMKPMGMYNGTHNNFKADGSSGNKASGFTNLGVKWACSSENSSYINQLGLSGGDCASTLRSKMGYSGYNPSIEFYDGGTGILSEAQSLFNQAMAAAANAKSGNNSSESEGRFTLNASIGDITVNESTVEIIATFDIKEATVNDYIKNINFQLNGNGYKLDTIEYTVNNETNTLENNSDTNIIETLVSSLENNKTVDNTVTIKITLTKTFTDSEDCEPATFTIDYLYSGSQSFNVVILKYNSSIQDMIIGSSDVATGGAGEPSENNGTLEGEIPCDDSEEIVCGTLITTPVCSDDDEKSSSDIVAPEDIKKCILGFDNANGNPEKKDDVDNSYKLSDSFGGLSDNDYCQVYCKEDYKDVLNSGENNHGIILQPKIDDVVCGGYFQLKAHIEGAKDCYTAGNTGKDAENGEKSIDKEKYIKDIKKVQEQLVDALNNYNEAKAKLDGINAAGEGKTEPLTCGDETVKKFSITVTWDSFTTYTFEWDEENEEGSVNSSNTSSNYNYIPKNFEDETLIDDDPNGYNGKFSDSKVTCNETKNKDGSTSYKLSGTVSAKDKYDAWVKAVKDQYNNMPDYIESLQEKYREIITEYNSCITGWYITYDFAQTLRYYYDETQGEPGDYTTTIPYFDLIQDNVDNTIMVPDEEKPYEYLVDVEICKETATNEYECEGESVTIEGLEEDKVGERLNEAEPDGKSYGYAALFDKAFENKNYVICDTDGCKTDTRHISQASFVRKSIKKAQDYISPSVFWQIAANGKITTSSSGNNVELEQLEHMLPVSTKSVLGGTFRLMLEDFGEFYDPSDFNGADKYGRLMDYMGDNASDSIASLLVNSGISDFDGNYECYYINNCKPDNCPDCDFEGTDIPNCPNCTFTPSTCVNCIFNLDELQINVKPINPSDVINPDRTYGYNWTVNTELGRLELISDKAEMTINEIKQNNDLIYSSTKVTDENGLAFSIRLDASAINYLKEYNAAQENNGGYANDSLTCKDATFGELTVKNLFCYSDVITKLVEDNSNGSIPEGFEDKRNDVNTYWTTFPNWQEIVGDEKTDAGQSYVIGGPAWK